MSANAANDDWRAIQAERYRQAKAAGGQQHKETTARGCSWVHVLGAFLASAAPAARSGKQQPLSKLLLQLFTLTCQTLAWLRKVYSKTSRKHAAALLVIMICFIPSAIQQWERWQENKMLNISPMPDSNMRLAHQHRPYMLSKRDFVNVYASNQIIKVNSSTVMGGWTVEDLRWSIGGDITRCATTQYAAVTYFCGKTLADTEHFGRLPGFNSSQKLANFIKELEQQLQAGNTVTNPTSSSASDGDDSEGTNDDDTSSSISSSEECAIWPEYIFRCNLHEASDYTVGHTFVIHILPDGAFQVYQSFIGHYTLQHYLEDHGPMTMQQFMAFLDNIGVLENATEWTRVEDRAYHQNFMVSLRKSSSKDGPLGGWKHLHKRKDNEKRQHIKFIAEPICIAGVPKQVVFGSRVNDTEQQTTEVHYDHQRDVDDNEYSVNEDE